MQKLLRPRTTLLLIRSLNSKAVDLVVKRKKLNSKSFMMKIWNLMKTSLLNSMKYQMASVLLVRTLVARLLSWMITDQECWHLLRKKRLKHQLTRNVAVLLSNVLMVPMETLKFNMKPTKSINLTELQHQVSTMNTLLELLFSSTERWSRRSKSLSFQELICLRIQREMKSSE